MTFPTAAPDGSYPAPGVRTNYSVTISNGTSLSSAVDLGGTTLFAIQIPASWTTANITFQASADGVTYANLYDSTGTEVTVTAAASEFIVFSSPAPWLGIRFIKIRSGTSGTPVNQAADRALSIVSVA